MNDAAFKETRRVLRLIQNHVNQLPLNQGASVHSVGLVDVVYHPHRDDPALNFVTPRKNTAWVSAKEVEQGLQYLREHQRTSRLIYIEGLYPPMFAKSLAGMAMNIVSEQPVLVYKADTPPVLPSVSDGVAINTVTTHEGSAIWWYTWRNAYYDVVTNTAEPALIGMDMFHQAQGTQLDLVLYRYRFPVGVARLTLFPENGTAQIGALALLKELRTPEMLRLLQLYAVRAAVERACKLVYMFGESENDRRLSRENGFIDSGSVVCYAEKPAQEDGKHDPLAQPILTLR